MSKPDSNSSPVSILIAFKALDGTDSYVVMDEDEQLHIATPSPSTVACSIPDEEVKFEA